MRRTDRNPLKRAHGDMEEESKSFWDSFTCGQCGERAEFWSCKSWWFWGVESNHCSMGAIGGHGYLLGTWLQEFRERRLFVVTDSNGQKLCQSSTLRLVVSYARNTPENFALFVILHPLKHMSVTTYRLFSWLGERLSKVWRLIT